MYQIAFIDTEVGIKDECLKDIGAVKQAFDFIQMPSEMPGIRGYEAKYFHFNDKKSFEDFLKDADFICGHNILDFDMKYIGDIKNKIYIDSLYISALLFPSKYTHKLSKDEKLSEDAANNPLNDSEKCMELFYREVEKFYTIDKDLVKIFAFLLYDDEHFRGFFDFLNIKKSNVTEKEIAEKFYGEICLNSDIKEFISNYPVHLAYVLSYIKTGDKNSISPWILKNYPETENIYYLLRGKNCGSCDYCLEKLDAKKALKEYFKFDSFRTYDGEALQEQAVKAAIDDKSLIAIFPTGGGKSLTFQLPALVKGRLANALTVVISPLQSLMKDQVDNLLKSGIITASYVNGLLKPIERASVFENIKNGNTNIVYLSPESLRSSTVERILSQRYIDRFVIDEAHCFSSWGHDFRVDYMYIADFINKIRESKTIRPDIKVSCFTATAKQKVISDIKDYFQKNMDLSLEVFSTEATRENLKYNVIFRENNDEKYETTRRLILENNCPTIVYTSRVNTTEELALRLSKDGITARPYNGKMDSKDKIKNQEDFIKNEISVIVATSAFGMGVDKDDVQLVIHYDISNSLENYIQEAGRAGRDLSLDAKCYILYNEDDLDKHFMLLNQTKLSMSEIQNVWKAIKEMSGNRKYICKSALEIARQAGWDENIASVEMRVKTAIGALESAGYIKREHNRAQIYASSINCENMTSASQKIQSLKLDKKTEENCKMILSALFTEKYDMESKNKGSKIDYLSDILAIDKKDIIEAVNIMRENSILKDDKDMTAVISGTKQKAMINFGTFSRLENFIISEIEKSRYDEKTKISYDIKELNEMAVDEGIAYSSVKNIKSLYYFWHLQGYIKKTDENINKFIEIELNTTVENFKEKYNIRMEISRFIIDTLYLNHEGGDGKESITVNFSIIDIVKKFQENEKKEISVKQAEEAILYLSKIGVLNVQGGFLIIYNPMTISRKEMSNRIKYKISDYSVLNNFYKQKIQQIHIVGEYANMMVRNYQKAVEFVRDYFYMDYEKFIYKYFDEKRRKEISRNITRKKYRQLFDLLSPKQLEIIDDDKSKFIVVAAGPGSGKTRILVHKLASLLLLEDIKSEQLLMVTFSRAAATEFKKRLVELIGNAANFVTIKTFHSYCFDLIGEIGSLEKSENIVEKAIEKIENDMVEPIKITKSVIVVDEAQDMDFYEYRLLELLMEKNDDIRIILVGDDDQNIYSFRGSDSKYMTKFLENENSKKYELVTNYRSKNLIVEFSNIFVEKIKNRIKTNPGIAYDKEQGSVKLVKHMGKNMEQAVVNEVIEDSGNGFVCILTNTNDEALRINGLLTGKNINSTLIQSNDGFKFYNLYEVRYILDYIEKNIKTPVIEENIWKEVKTKFASEFKKSRCLDICMNMLKEVEETGANVYFSDFKEFVKESNYEDFYDKNEKTVVVSTIHKSKGREFDRVYMLLNDTSLESEDEKRKIFVGMTRAKKHLSIHYNNEIFDDVKLEGIKYDTDEKNYDEIDDITVQLSYKDVYLDFFKTVSILNDEKNENLPLYSGLELGMRGYTLYAIVEGRDVDLVKFSKRFKDKLNYLSQRGFYPYRANIRYIVKWTDKEKDEYTIVLPDIYFKKK